MGIANSLAPPMSIRETDGVIIAEWADKFPELLPEGTCWLRFEIEPDGSRSVSRFHPDAL